MERVAGNTQIERPQAEHVDQDRGGDGRADRHPTKVVVAGGLFNGDNEPGANRRHRARGGGTYGRP